MESMKKLRSLGPILLSISPIFGFVGMWCALDSFRLVKDGFRAEGIVVERQGRPVVTFVDCKGGHCTLGSNDFPTMTVGERVTVLYDSERPSKTTIYNFWKLWLFPSMFCLLSLAAAIFGIVLLRFSRVTLPEQN